MKAEQLRELLVDLTIEVIAIEQDVLIAEELLMELEDCLNEYERESV